MLAHFLHVIVFSAAFVLARIKILKFIYPAAVLPDTYYFGESCKFINSKPLDTKAKKGLMFEVYSPLHHELSIRRE